MKQINYNRSADLSLESSIRHKEESKEALKMGALSSSTHKVSLPNSVYLTFQQSAFFWGFFISARTPNQIKHHQGGGVEGKPETFVACRQDVWVTAKTPTNES